MQPGNRKLLGEFIDENEPWLFGMPSRDSFLVTNYLERHSVSLEQHMKELIPLREGLHVEICNATYDSTMHKFIQHRGASTRRKFTKGSITYFMKGPRIE